MSREQYKKRARKEDELGIGKRKKKDKDAAGEHDANQGDGVCGGAHGGLPPGASYEQIDTQGLDLTIKKIETSKDQIEQPLLAKDPRKIVPSLGHSIIINGKSGCGKSTLLANIMTGEAFFGKSKEKPNGWFDKVFLFSPTAGGDDVQQALGIPKKHVYTNLEDAPELLEVIQRTQKEQLDGGGKAHKVPQYCIIFDDVIGDTKFLNSREFMKMFYMVRHINCTTIICAQHYKKVPKNCRLQAGFVFFFAGSQAEVDQIVEDFAPPLYTRNEFRELVMDATRGDHEFLTVCMKVGWADRFRKNLTEFIHLERLSDYNNNSGKNGDDAKNKDPKAQEEKKQPDPTKKNTKSSAGVISVDSHNEFHKNLKAITEYFLGKHNERQNEQARRKSCQRLY